MKGGEQLLPIGTILLNRYRVERQLASGGFGNTYEVTNINFGERWAMKEFFMKSISEREGSTTSLHVLSASKSQFESQRNKFNKEARRLRKLKHPGIVHVEDLFDDNNTSYYIMDYIGGGSLAEAIKRHGPLSEKKVKELLPQLLDALEYVHNQKIWHLDLKPGNILLKDDGTPVIIDFGASKQLGSGGAHSTSLGMTYTQGYAPSEQVDQNLDRIGPWTDLYALGATLYNLISGNTPPMVSEIQEAEAEAFKFPNGMSEQMKSLILWMMNPNRRKRPQSVKEVRSFLESPSSNSSAQKKVEQDTGETVLPDTDVQKPHKKEKPKEPTPKAKENNPTPMPWYKKPVIILAAVVTAIALITVMVWPRGEETFTVGGVTFKMIKVEGGTFTMGATAEQGSEVDSDEKPTHRVTLSTYYIGETEVTQALWQAVMGTTVSQQRDKANKEWSLRGEGANYPMYYVSWEECQEFVRKLNRMTGKSFRLPTEAEWEFAARGGNKSRGYKYSGSNTIDDVVWYWKNSGDKYLPGTDSDWDPNKIDNNNCRAHIVKTKKPNELGIYDMNGNVWEWCQDWYSNYSSSSQTNPTGPSSGSDRVLRGVGWAYEARDCHVSNRGYSSPSIRNFGLGLRLAL